MKSTVTRLYLLFTLVIALLLFPSSPARADAAVELTSVRLMIDGREQSLGFRPDRLEYEISYVSSVPVEITVEAEAMAGCNLRIDNVPYAGGSGSATWSTADSCIINLQVYYKTHQQLYLIHVNILLPDPPAPSGGQETGGEPENNEEGPAGGGQNSGNGGQNSGNGGQNSGNGGQGSGNSGQDSGNGGQGSGNSGQNSGNGGQGSGNSGQNSGNGGQGSGNGGAPVDVGSPESTPSVPEQEDVADDPQPEPGADPQRDQHTAHLILYIGAPFLLADETYIQADTAPYLVTDEKGGGYTMVPVRFIAEALGAYVSWDGIARKVGIDLDGRHFELTIGELVPGTPVAAVIRDSRTFVPLRYVMESFGARVEWTQRERRIDIYYTPQSRPE